MLIAERKALLTGATGGIGQAIAQELHRQRAELTLTGRRTAELKQLSESLSASSVSCDLTIQQDLEELLKLAADTDLLVVNAALPATGQILDLDSEKIDRALEVNLHAPIKLARAAAAEMVKRGYGHIVFISSLSGKSSTAGSSIYSATKFGLRAFAQAAREELADQGVGVSSIFPGFISDAGMFADTGVKLPKGVGTKTPEEVAKAVTKVTEKNIGELDVAPAQLRAATVLSSLFPELSSKLRSRTPANKITAELIEAQKHKR